MSQRPLSLISLHQAPMNLQEEVVGRAIPAIPATPGMRVARNLQEGVAARPRRVRLQGEDRLPQAELLPTLPQHEAALIR